MQLFFSEIYNKIYRNSIDILFIEYKMFYSLFIISKLFVTIQYFSGLGNEGKNFVFNMD